MKLPGPRDDDAGPDLLGSALAAAKWTGADPTKQQIDLLIEFRDWLAHEAIPAGSVGPNEGRRLWRRHIADSLLFAYGIGDRKSCLDIGSGGGLPGIPLAIIHPQTHFDLVDKSGRRCDLLRRAIRILGLDNCTVVHRDVSQLEEHYAFVVSRAAIPAAKLMIHVKHRLEPGGVANVSVSRSGDAIFPAAVPDGLKMTVISIPPGILDTKVQLLRIEAIQNGS